MPAAGQGWLLRLPVRRRYDIAIMTRSVRLRESWIWHASRSDHIHDARLFDLDALSARQLRASLQRPCERHLDTQCAIALLPKWHQLSNQCCELVEGVVTLTEAGEGNWATRELPKA